MTTALHDASVLARSLAAPISLRLRLTLWIAAIALVIHLTLTVIVLLYQRVSVQDFLDARYQPRVTAIVAEVRSAGFELDESRWNQLSREHLDTPLHEPYMATMYVIPSREPGRVMLSTWSEPPACDEVRRWIGPHRESIVWRDSAPRTVGAGQVLAQSRTFVQRLYGAGGTEYLLTVTASDSSSASVLSVLSSVLMMTIPAGVLAAGVAGYLISGLIIRPIRQLRHLTGAMSPEQLDRPVSVGSTVPELALLQDELEESRRRLRAALVAHDRFISNVSHELKTPVAVLLTEAQTIDRTGLTPDQKRFVESVTDEMRRLGRMVESFLTLTRVRAGKAIANAERCDLNEVVMDSIETCSAMARQQSVFIEPLLLDDAAGAEMLGDCELLRIMIDNLIRNAIRFSPEGARVVIAVEAEAERWAVRVRDEGPGIPVDLLGSLFDRFTQASSEIIRGRGYGLGLSIAQGIAELHAGGISVQNLPMGCEFLIRLPRLTPETTADSEPAPSVEARNETPR